MKLTNDSREIKKGDIFIAYKGVNQDLHKYIKDARKNGAFLVIGENDDCDIKVKDGREAMATLSAAINNNPAKKLKLIGITGTNGKTSTALMLAEILNAGYIGTLGDYDETTPNPIILHKLLNDFVRQGKKYAVIETTSQGLDQKRLFGLEFEVGVFTNLTQDHLDYHKNFKDYLKAKQILFEQSKIAILNRDDPASKKIKHNKKIYYDKSKLKLKMPGEFNKYNAGAAIAAAKMLGFTLRQAQDKIKDVIVPGRFEPVGDRAIVDYAHTPDALEQLLINARQLTKDDLICVFGCGGDRDPDKRPKMGKIATELSDKVYITSDNPRTENPDNILKDIKTGVKKENFVIIKNRRQAIKKAILESSKNDLIVIAGKGHEDYQILGKRKIHFDDREEARKWL